MSFLLAVWGFGGPESCPPLRNSQGYVCVNRLSIGSEDVKTPGERRLWPLPSQEALSRHGWMGFQRLESGFGEKVDRARNSAWLKRWVNIRL